MSSLLEVDCLGEQLPYHLQGFRRIRHYFTSDHICIEREYREYIRKIRKVVSLTVTNVRVCIDIDFDTRHSSMVNCNCSKKSVQGR